MEKNRILHIKINPGKIKENILNEKWKWKISREKVFENFSSGGFSTALMKLFSLSYSILFSYYLNYSHSVIFLNGLI